MLNCLLISQVIFGHSPFTYNGKIFNRGRLHQTSILLCNYSLHIVKVTNYGHLGFPISQ
jgi:hypothetical protein